MASEKAKLAFSHAKIPLIIEDTALCYNALNGMPGPYIKDFYKSLKNEGLCKLLDGKEDKSATAQCIVAYIDESCKDNPKLFPGRTTGQIVMPRGNKGFGWDLVF